MTGTTEVRQHRPDAQLEAREVCDHQYQRRLISRANTDQRMDMSAASSNHRRLPSFANQPLSINWPYTTRPSLHVWFPAFASACPTVCNLLPEYLRNPLIGHDQFRRDLKTFLRAQLWCFVDNAIKVLLMQSHCINSHFVIYLRGKNHDAGQW